MFSERSTATMRQKHNHVYKRCVFSQERYIFLRTCIREKSPLHHLLIGFDKDVLWYHTSWPCQEQNLFTSTTSRSQSRAFKSGLLWLGFWTEVTARSSQLRKNKHENLPFTHSLVGRRGRLNANWEEHMPSSWETPTASATSLSWSVAGSAWENSQNSKCQGKNLLENRK